MWSGYDHVGEVHGTRRDRPDLFYFLQDYNGATLGPLSDDIMLAFATYYFYDAASEDNWEPLLVILDQVNSTLAGLLRFLIKLQQIWQDFINAWNATIGPVADAIGEIADDLLGGVLSELGVLGQQLMDGIKELSEEELLTYADIFGFFDTCVQKGFREPMFLWSDMRHYRKPATLARKLVEEAESLKQAGFEDRYRAVLGFFPRLHHPHRHRHVAHSFVNEQCGGPTATTRSAIIRSRTTSTPGTTRRRARAVQLEPDPWGKTDDYPDLSMSAMWFAVQMRPRTILTASQRPTGLPDDPDQRKALLDKDGELPDWMAESIVKRDDERVRRRRPPADLRWQRLPVRPSTETRCPSLVQQITGARPRSTDPGADRRNRPDAVVRRQARLPAAMADQDGVQDHVLVLPSPVQRGVGAIRSRRQARLHHLPSVVGHHQSAPAARLQRRRLVEPARGRVRVPAGPDRVER